MSQNTTLEQRLTELAETTQSAICKRAVEQLFLQKLHAQFSAETIKQWSEEFKLSPVEIALECLPIAASYSVAPASNFYVGAVAIGLSGNFYLGANYEFAGEAIQQSVHAEQSAISHALMAKESGLSDVVVNYTPCGHCRQFMNELNTASQLKIHLPHSQNNLLHSYLPDAFGPKDLNIKSVLFDPQSRQFASNTDPLIQAAIQAASESYAPYSQAVSGIALQVGDKIITGQCAENAAFNPSFLPLQSALNYQRMLGFGELPIQRVVMAEEQGILSHRSITATLTKKLLGLELEYIAI